VRDSQVSLILSRPVLPSLTLFLQSKTPSLIFEYVNNTDFRSLYPKFADIDVRYYIFELLKVIDTSPIIVRSFTNDETRLSTSATARVSCTATSSLTTL
jgi:hypothetical protein